MQSGGTLIIPESSMTPQHRLVTICVNPIAAHIPELSLHVLGTSEDSLQSLLTEALYGPVTYQPQSTRNHKRQQ